MKFELNAFLRRGITVCACVVVLANLVSCGPQDSTASAAPASNATPGAAPKPAPATAAENSGEESADPAGAPDEITDSFEVVDLTALDMLLKEHRGKTVVLNFWATWCPPCVAEMPEFAEFYREHKGDDSIVVLSVTADDPTTIETAVKPFVAKHKIPFPIRVMSFMPSEELTGVLGYEWVDGNLPATFVYKPDGTLQNVWFVQITKADLDKAVAKTMAQKN